MKYLVDTNTLSEPFQQRPRDKVVRRLRQHAGEIAMAATTWQELLYGQYGQYILPPSRKREELGNFLALLRTQIPVYPFGEVAARWQAEQRAALRRVRTPSYPDTLIAAVAVERGLVLVTANVKHVRDFEGLRYEDWTA